MNTNIVGASPYTSSYKLTDTNTINNNINTNNIINSNAIK
jgi:hypothetical protein